MTLPAGLESTFATIGGLLAAMAALALLEAVIPLHARGRWSRAHLAPNLALTFVTFATNLFLNAALLALLFWLESLDFGLLRWLQVPWLAAALVSLAALDLAFYAAHVSWHRFPALWRFHAVHHSDPTVDVTTTIRQHPVESLLRYAAMAAMVIAIGPSPAAFAVYRAASALNGQLEHANLRLPLWLDRMLAWITTWPYMHKIHHSRRPEQTDTNYGNLFSIFDRLFSTFTPSPRGVDVVYGLEGLDDPASQTTLGLLALPLRELRLSLRAARAGTPRGRAPAAR